MLHFNNIKHHHWKNSSHMLSIHTMPTTKTISNMIRNLVGNVPVDTFDDAVYFSILGSNTRYKINRDEYDLSIEHDGISTMLINACYISSYIAEQMFNIRSAS